MELNWVDAVLMIMLVSMIIVGSRKGLIRELMAFFIFVAAIIVAIKYIDQVAIRVHDNLGGSTLISALISFVLVMAIAYGAFKLVGLVFYRVARLNTLGRKDKVGGALVGALRGWVALSMLLFLSLLMPLPESYYREFKASALGPTIVRTLPLIYDKTSALHPASEDFYAKIENMLLYRTNQSEMTPDERQAHRLSRRDAYRVIYLIDSLMAP